MEKDPQGRAANPHLDQSDLEKLFREHVKTLQEVYNTYSLLLLMLVLNSSHCFELPLNASEGTFQYRFAFIVSPTYYLCVFFFFLQRCSSEFRTLLTEVITLEAAAQETEDGKTVLTSWSTAKLLLKSDARYTKLPRKDRESLWRRHVEEIQRRQKSAIDQETEKHKEPKNKSSVDSGKHLSGGSRRTRDRR